MADTLVEITLPTGITGATLSLFPEGSDSGTVSGLALSELTNKKGRYQATVNQALTGLHDGVVFDSGGNFLASAGVFDLLDDTSVYHELDRSDVRAMGQSTIDGVSLDSLMEIALAFFAGQWSITDHGDGEKTYSFKKQDGSTEKYNVRFNSQGEHISTSITN